MEAPSTVVLVLALALVLAAFLPLGLRLGRRRREEVRAAWRRLANELGSRFEESSGSWLSRRPFQFGTRAEAIEQTIGRLDDSRGDLHPDSEVRLDSYVVSTGQHSVTYTRASLELTSTHSLFIRREQALSGLGKLLGLQDVRVPNIEYDRGFLIKADDESWLRERLSPELMRLHLRHPKVALRLEDGTLTAARTGLIRDRPNLLAQLQLAVLAARAFGR